MAIRKARLPSAYKEVEYIESTGTQYIDSGFNAQNGFKIKMNFQLTQSSIQRNCIFGLNGNANESFFRVNSPTTYSFWANVQGSSGFTYDTFVNNQIYSIECVFDSSSYLKINNVEVKRLTTTKSFGNNSIPLLAEKDISTSNMTSYSKCRLYKCQIYELNNTIVRDFVPCYRVADNEIGLYDMVNGVFYTNAGTGTFLKGNDVLPKIVKLYKGSTQIIKRFKGTQLIYNALPSEFQEVEYIESSGTQYIDSGVLAGGDIRIVSRFNVTQNADNCIFGGRDSTSLSFQFIKLPNSPYSFRTDYFGNTTQFSGVLNTWYEIDKNKNITYINGTVVSTLAYSNFTTQSNITLFARNQLGVISAYAYVKIGITKIYDNGTIIRNFIPCYRKADNVAGLYDLVNGVFYTNAGTGTFIVGPDVGGDTPEPTVTDLTNTSWVLNKIPTLPSPAEDYDIIFSTYDNGQLHECSGIGLGWSGVLSGYEIVYNINSNDFTVYNSDNDWVSQSYRIIEITGGTDATNQNLIDWLQANATQVTLISFTINFPNDVTETCQAEQGMTWAQWCDSNYNDIDALINSGVVTFGAMGWTLPGVNPNDTIVANGSYTVNSGGSND